jgi:hypothetical protein
MFIAEAIVEFSKINLPHAQRKINYNRLAKPSRNKLRLNQNFKDAQHERFLPYKLF